ncbi:MAG: MarR family transcriptional regulator [Clostridiales bacterium]|nr:MarR family transcriptional regulator [Clostridiales bacterium]
MKKIETGDNIELLFLLRDIGDIIRMLYEGRGSQKNVLITLLESGAITQSDLTRRIGVRPGSASEVLSKLERGGLIERTCDKADRRTADISLTAEGEAQARAASEARIKRHAEMFSCLTAEEKRQMIALADKLYRDWEKRYSM